MFSIVSRNEDMNVEIISNGFLMSVTGRSKDSSYMTQKIYLEDLDSLFKAIEEFVDIPQYD